MQVAAWLVKNRALGVRYIALALFGTRTHIVISLFRQFPRTLRQHMKRVSNSGYDLLSRMLEYDPNKRITAAEALDHEYFKEAPLPMKK